MIKKLYLCVVLAVLVAQRVVQGRRSLLARRNVKRHSGLTPFALDGGLEDGVRNKVGISETDVNFLEVKRGKYKKIKGYFRKRKDEADKVSSAAQATADKAKNTASSTFAPLIRSKRISSIKRRKVLNLKILK